MLCLCSKTYCCYDNKSDMFKFSSKGLNKRALEDFGDGPMANSHGRRVFDEAVNLTSTNRGIRTVNQMVVANEQTKKGIACADICTQSPKKFRFFYHSLNITRTMKFYQFYSLS